jgi:Spy/CpxP family protein refolding chaperone
MRRVWIKNTVLMLGMTLSSAALLAQQPVAPAPETTTQAATQSATQSAASVTAKTQLTAEQKKQLHELRASARDQAAIIRNDQTLTNEQKQAKLKAVRTSTRQQMKALLTPEQQKAFADRRTASRARIAAKLGLSADQQSKLKGLASSNRRQRQGVLKNASLTNEQKQAQLSQIRQASQVQLAAILTPQQLEQFHQMRAMRGHAKQE